MKRPWKITRNEIVISYLCSGRCHQNAAFTPPKKNDSLWGSPPTPPSRRATSPSALSPLVAEWWRSRAASSSIQILPVQRVRFSLLFSPKLGSWAECCVHPYCFMVLSRCSMAEWCRCGCSVEDGHFVNELHVAPNWKTLAVHAMWLAIYRREQLESGRSSQ